MSAREWHIPSSFPTFVHSIQPFGCRSTESRWSPWSVASRPPGFPTVSPAAHRSGTLANAPNSFSTPPTMAAPYPHTHQQMHLNNLLGAWSMVPPHLHIYYQQTPFGPLATFPLPYASPWRDPHYSLQAKVTFETVATAVWSYKITKHQWAHYERDEAVSAEKQLIYQGDYEEASQGLEQLISQIEMLPPASQHLLMILYEEEKGEYSPSALSKSQLKSPPVPRGLGSSRLRANASNPLR